MAYVNGSVCSVPVTAKDAFIKHAHDFAALARKHGATDVQDCWEDDVPDGEVTSFPMAVQRKEGEAIAFSWIVWPDKATCDAAWEAMMGDPMMQAAMPFDGKRMIFGSFETVQ